MENGEVINGRVDFSNCGLLTEGVQVGESAEFTVLGINEKFLLQDLDDLNSRVIVSRMANNSITKGICKAVAQEAIEEISLKEAEVEVLKEMMFPSELDRTWCNSCSSLTEDMSEGSTCEDKMDLLDQSIRNGDLRLVMKKQLQMIKNEIRHLQNMGSGINQHNILESLDGVGLSIDMLNTMSEATFELNDAHYCPFKELLCEQQWEYYLEKEIHNVVVEHFIKDVQGKCQRKLSDEYFYSNERKKLLSKRNELLRLREELYGILTSILGPEPGSLEIYEERRSCSKKVNASRKVLASHLSSCSTQIHENGSITVDIAKKPVVEVMDIAKLSHLSKEELITYFMTEMAKMSRQHESSLHEKTEELFRTKRQLLRERGSSPFRKDNEFDILRNKMLEFILKLDNIIASEDDILLITQEDHDLMCTLKDHVDVLLAENRHLKDLLVEKRKEVKSLSSRILEASIQMSHHTSTEIKFIEQMRKLRQDLEDTKMEAVLRDEMLNVILTNWIGSIRNKLENLHTEVNIDYDVHLMVLTESIKHANLIANAILQRHKNEEIFLKSELSKKDEALLLEVIKTDKLQNKITSLLKLVEQKEKLSQDNMSMLVIQQQKVEVLCQEMKVLQKQKEEEERLVLLKDQEICLLKDRLEDAISQIYQHELEIQITDERFKVAQTDLEESEKQRAVLENIIQDEKIKASSAIMERDLVAKKMKALVLHLVGLSKSLDEFESKVTERICRHDSRLKNLKHLWDPVTLKAHNIQREVLWYRTNLEIKTSNLQIAEEEVDLLADEVEDLLSILEKVYLALDRYSLVLQHYPGVMEILKLVRKELEESVLPHR